MSAESVSAETFARESLAVLQHITESSRDSVSRAAELIADCVRTDGVVQAFGTGHSQAMVLELAGRAGGLVPTNRLGITDLVLYGGDAPSVLDDPLLERRAGVADRLYDLAAPRPEDLFVIISNSGVNKVIVEMALRVKERGHRLLAITSLAHTRAVPAGTRAARSSPTSPTSSSTTRPRAATPSSNSPRAVPCAPCPRSPARCSSSCRSPRRRPG